jgi:AraC-like DNA-binding protein
MGSGKTTSATALRLFVDALSDLGIDWEPILRGCGVDPAVLQDSEARIAEDRFDRIWPAAAEYAGDPCIGLHAGERVHPRAVNLFGYLLLSSATVREGIERVAHYQRVLTGSPWLAVDDSATWTHVRVGMEHADDETRAIHSEYVALLVLGFLRWVTGTDIRPIEARFEHRARSDPAEYTRALRCPVKFRFERSEIVFPTGALDRPSRHANDEIARLHDEFAARLLERTEEHHLGSRVRKTLAGLLEVGPRDLKSIARHLHMSPRTLQRRLAEEGATFLGVLDLLRKELAVEHLRKQDTPISEVAYLTGFSEVSAFARAVRRWVGCTPLECRRGEPERSEDPGR